MDDVEWAIAERALPGEEENADLAVVEEFPRGTLVAAVDGLGHGPEAVVASRSAARILRDHARESPLSLIRRCHQGLRKTRGVVLTLASFDHQRSTLVWSGVGNVDGRLVRRESGSGEAVVLMGGIVGYELPVLRSSTLSVEPGDLLVLATDGIRSDFRLSIDADLSPQEIADRILKQHAKETDDALVLVARYRGDT